MKPYRIGGLLVMLAAAGYARKTVRDFGAAGDGKTDDTAALQRAVDAGEPVRLPRGRYKLTQPVVVDLDRRGPFSITGDGTATLIMAGAGPALKLAGTHRGSADPGQVKENVWERQRMPLLDGFEILGAHPGAVGVHIDGAMQATLTRLLIRRALHGIYLTGRNRNVILSDSHIYENRGVGVLLEKLNLHQVNITGSHISYNGGGGVVVRESEVRNLHIGTCDIESNMAQRGPPTANVLLDARIGSIREAAITGSTLQHNRDAAGSANIRLIGRGVEDERKVGNLTIADNVLSDVAVNVHLQHARGVILTGNTFWQGYQYDLLVEGSTNVVVGPNLFDRNPDYGSDSPNGLAFFDSADCTINGIHIQNATPAEAALLVRRCRRFHITNATILNSGPVGMLLDDVRDTRVSGCLIRDDRPGGRRATALRLTRGQGNLVVHNLFAGEIDIAQGSAHIEGNR